MRRGRESKSATPTFKALLIVRNTFDVLKEGFEPLDPDETRIEITG